MEDTDRIEVKVIEGRDLPIPSSGGGVCNPVVRLTCAFDVALTKTLNNTNDPKWPEHGNAVFFEGLAKRGTDHILAEVMHKDYATGQFETLGQVPLALAGPMLQPGIPVDEW